MGSDINEVLQQAMEFYVAGQKVEAKALLLDLVRANPKLEAGWMFLSYTLDDPIQKADCLRQVLKINPQNMEAKGTLEQLIPTQKPGPPLPIPAAAHASPFTVDISHANDNVIETGLLPEGINQRAGDGIPPFPETPKSETQTRQVVERQAEPVPPTAIKPPAPVTAENPPKEDQAPVVIKPIPVPVKPIAKPVEAHEAPKPKKRGNLGCACLSIAIIGILIVGTTVAGLWLTGYLPAFFAMTQPGGAATATPSATETPIVWTLPPRWTDTPPPTITSTPTISPTPTQTFTPTLVPPDATQQTDIAKLEKQVMDLRGLEWDGAPPIYIVSQDQAETILQLELDQSGYKASIGNQSKVLVALGMIKPTYDLAKYALTRLSDGVLGFYVPSDRSIYVIGNQFGGMQHFVFSHEYDHALVNHFFPAVGINDTDTICVNDSQRCEAIRDLVEGDATLLMAQWYDQYATAYDKRDIGLYRVPFSLPPEDNTPAYVGPLADFPYTAGANFVYSLWVKGYWAAVNRVYDNLPVSTEQILHPEKYLAGELPVVMTVPGLQPDLGNGWTLIGSDSLGEYMTYLLLSYGADNIAEIPTATGLLASAGWGGDHYIVYASPAGNQTVLAAEWSWDTDKDAGEFLSAMRDYLDKRFRGEKPNPPVTDCWSMNKETTCLFHANRNTLWVLAPDLATINKVLSSYTAYS